MLPEELAQTAARLRPIFERLAARRVTAEHAEDAEVNWSAASSAISAVIVMILELTPEQHAFSESIEQFAREVVAPRAAAIDESGEFPLDVMRAAPSAACSA